MFSHKQKHVASTRTFLDRFAKEMGAQSHSRRNLAFVYKRSRFIISSEINFNKRTDRVIKHNTFMIWIVESRASLDSRRYKKLKWRALSFLLLSNKVTLIPELKNFKKRRLDNYSIYELSNFQIHQNNYRMVSSSFFIFLF